MKRLIPALFCVALCTSCSPPLFDLMLSQGAAAAKSMTRDNPSTITVSWDAYQEGDGFVLYPRVESATNGFDYSSGFIVFTNGFSVEVRGLGAGGQSQPINPDPLAPAYAAWPVKSTYTTTAYLFGLVFNSSDPSKNGYALFQGAPTSTDVLNIGPMSGKTGMTGDTVIGASFAAQSTSPDVTSLLVSNAGAYREMQLPMTTPSLATSATLIRSGAYAFLPSGVNRFQYFYDVNPGVTPDPARTPNRSFASWYDTASGGWKCVAWWGTSGTGDWKTLDIGHRIDALLSTGELLSMEEGTGRLYSRDGVLLSTFPLGNLVFIGEEYVGTAFRSYFSQCLRYDDALHFNVYWIETDRVKDIGR